MSILTSVAILNKRLTLLYVVASYETANRSRLALAYGFNAHFIILFLSSCWNDWCTKYFGDVYKIVNVMITSMAHLEHHFKCCSQLNNSPQKEAHSTAVVWMTNRWKPFVVKVVFVKHKINSKTPGLAKTVVHCSGFGWISPWWRCPGRTQGNKKKIKHWAVCILSCLYFLSHFHKTCTGEGKAFQ